MLAFRLFLTVTFTAATTHRHVEHFTCTGCHCLLHDQAYQVVDKKPYCAACYLRISESQRV